MRYRICGRYTRAKMSASRHHGGWDRWVLREKHRHHSQLWSVVTFPHNRRHARAMHV